MNKINLKEHLADSKIDVRRYTRYRANRPDIKNLFIEAFLLTDQTVKDYEHLPEYDQVIQWLEDNEGKGLFMTGSLGRGKSTILYGVIPLLFKAFYNRIVKVVSARDFDSENVGWAVCIDDIGQEEIQNDFGTKKDHVESGISHCEDRMKLLIITSNLTKDQLLQRYGVRIVDRIDRLCKTVIFRGESKRKNTLKII